MNTKGIYSGTIMDGAVVSTAKSGSLQIVIPVKVTHFAQNGQWVAANLKPREDAAGDEDPNQIRMYLSLTDGAWPYTKAKLEELQFDGNMDEPTFGKTDPIMLVLKHHKYQDSLKESWELYGDWGTGIEKADSDKINRLQARWNADKASPPATTGAPQPPPTSSVQAKPPTTVPQPDLPPPAAGQAEKPAVPDVSGVTDKDSAWNHWIDRADDGQVDPDEFTKAISAVCEAEKIAEDAFTAGHWQQVAEAADIPF